MNKHVGFIGLGNMGNPMASHLIEAGYSLTVYDINQNVLKTFEDMGAFIAATPAEVASAAKTVILSLPNPTIVREVVLGTSGVIEGTAINTVIDMSTTGAKMAREIASALSEKAITQVDAPVSGGVPGAKVKKLAIMVACPDDRFEEIKMILSNIGTVFFIGNKPGMGQTMKLVNNVLSATALASTTEAMLYGAKAGLDPEIMIKVLNAGSGRNSATEDKYPRAILPRTFNLGFTAGLMCKDMLLCQEEVKDMGVPMAVIDAAREEWLEVEQEMGKDRDFTAIVEMLERRSGIELKKSKQKE